MTDPHHVARVAHNVAGARNAPLVGSRVDATSVVGTVDEAADRPEAPVTPCTGRSGDVTGCRRTVERVHLDRFGRMVHASVSTVASTAIGPGWVLPAGAMTSSSVSIGSGGRPGRRARLGAGACVGADPSMRKRGVAAGPWVVDAALVTAEAPDGASRQGVDTPQLQRA